MTNIDRLIKHFGGTQSSLARELGVTRALIAQWKQGSPIAPVRALQIERLSAGKFRAINLNPAGIKRLNKIGYGTAA